MTATNAGGSVTKSATLEVYPQPFVTSFTATPTVGVTGTPVQLLASFTGTAAWVDGFPTPQLPITSGVALDATFPKGLTQVTLTAMNGAGDTTQSYISLQGNAPGKLTMVGNIPIPPNYIAVIHGGGLDATGRPILYGEGQISNSGAQGIYLLSDPPGSPLGASLMGFPGSQPGRPYDLELIHSLDDGRLVVLDGGSSPKIWFLNPATGLTESVSLNWVGTSGYAYQALALDAYRILIVGWSAGDTSILDCRTRTIQNYGKMGVWRFGFSLQLLPDGRVLYAGGALANTQAIQATAQIFDPVEGIWTPTGSLVTGRKYHRSLHLRDGRILIAGGSGPLEWYNPQTGTFTQALNNGNPVYTSTRFEFTMTQLHDGRVMLIGGWNGTTSNGYQPNPVPTIEFIDPATLEVQSGPSFLPGGEFVEGTPKRPFLVPLPSGNTYVMGGRSTGAQSDWTLHVSNINYFEPQASLTVTPNLQVLHVGDSIQLSAGAEAVTWSIWEGAAGGNVDANGLYTAPATPGTFHIKAQSLSNSARHSTATIRVAAVPQGVITSFTADRTRIKAGESVTLTAIFSGGTGTISGVGNVTSGVPKILTPTTDCNYYLYVVDTNGMVTTSSLSILVEPVLNFFTVKDPVVVPGGFTTLYFDFKGGASAQLDDGINTWNIPSAGFKDIYPSKTTIYTLTIAGQTGGVTQSITVVVSAVTGIRLDSTPLRIYAGGQVSFAASLTVSALADPDVIWTVSPSAGTITPSGTNNWLALFIAPSGAGAYTVTATSVADPARSASLVVTVDPIVLTLTPAYLEMSPGDQYGFGYSSNAGGVTLSATGGTLGPDGVYAAPTAAGTYTLTATSVLDPSVSAVATVVVKPVTILISPKQATLAKNATYRFRALVSAGGVAWSATGGGSITSDGLYTAPSVDGTYTVKATSILQPGNSATAMVTIQDGGLSGGGGTGGALPTPALGGISIEPKLSQVPAGTYQALSATVFGVEDQSVTWEVFQNITDSVTGLPAGRVDAQGAFTSGLAGTYVVKATSSIQGTLFGTAVIQVESGIQRLFGTPAALNREFYSVTALNTGKILIAGGWDGTNPMGTCFLFDPETKTFTETGAMVIARSGAKAALLKDGRVLVAEGYGNRSIVTGIGTADMGPLPNAEIYDPASGAWSSSARFEQQDVNQGGSLVALPDGRALILGGDTYSGNNASNSVLFDGTNGFSTLSKDTLSWGKWFPMVQLKDGRVLYSGGYTGATRPPGNTDADWKIMQAAWLYNPADSTAVAAGTMVSKRMDHTATVLPDGKVLFVGGISHNRTPYGDYSNPDGWEPTATAEIYDPVAGTFTATGSLQIPRADHAALLLPTGQVMVAGGWTRLEILGDGTSERYFQNSVETFDPDTGTWRVTDLLKNGDESYGLDMPKLALQPDGGVFIAGKPIMGAAPPQLQSLAPSLNGKQAKIFTAKTVKGRNGELVTLVPQDLQAGSPTISAIFNQSTPLSLGRDYATMNQGVERYLNDANTKDNSFESDALLVFKQVVPGIAYRPAKIRINFKSIQEFTDDQIKKLKVKVEWLEVAGGGEKIEYLTADLTGLRFYLVMNLDQTQTLPGAKLRFTLDPERLVFPSTCPMEATRFDIDPKRTLANPITVYMYGIGYKHAGLSDPIYPDASYMNQVKTDLEQQIYEMLPVPWQNPDGSPSITVEVIEPRSRYCWDETGLYPFYTEATAQASAQCRINLGLPNLQPGGPNYCSPFVNTASLTGQWNVAVAGFLKAIQNLDSSWQWSPNTFQPQNYYFFGVMPRIAFHSDAMDNAGMAYKDWNGAQQTYRCGHAAIVMPLPVNAKQNPYVLIHELGHQLQVMHAPYWDPGMPKVKGIDDRWPWGATAGSNNGFGIGSNDYKDADVGVRGWYFSGSREVPTTSKDFMSYASYDPNIPDRLWTSDFCFTKFFEHQMNPSLPTTIPLRK